MSVLYLVFYDSKGKRKEKSIMLPAKAKEVKCDKMAFKRGSKHYAKITYKIGKEKKERLVNLPKDAENIIINPNWAFGKVVPPWF
jgi:hypothetical protein